MAVDRGSWYQLGRSMKEGTYVRLAFSYANPFAYGIVRKRHFDGTRSWWGNPVWRVKTCGAVVEVIDEVAYLHALKLTGNPNLLKVEHDW